MTFSAGLQVIGMLEKRVGEEPFKKLLERMVAASCKDSGKGEVDEARRLPSLGDHSTEDIKAGKGGKAIISQRVNFSLSIAGQVKDV